MALPQLHPGRGPPDNRPSAFERRPDISELIGPLSVQVAAMIAAIPSPYARAYLSGRMSEIVSNAAGAIHQLNALGGRIITPAAISSLGEQVSTVISAQLSQSARSSVEVQVAIARFQAMHQRGPYAGSLAAMGWSSSSRAYWDRDSSSDRSAVSGSTPRPPVTLASLSSSSPYSPIPRVGGRVGELYQSVPGTPYNYPPVPLYTRQGYPSHRDYTAGRDLADASFDRNYQELLRRSSTPIPGRSAPHTPIPAPLTPEHRRTLLAMNPADMTPEQRLQRDAIMRAAIAAVQEGATRPPVVGGQMGGSTIIAVGPQSRPVQPLASTARAVEATVQAGAVTASAGDASTATTGAASTVTAGAASTVTAGAGAGTQPPRRPLGMMQFAHAHEIASGTRVDQWGNCQIYFGRNNPFYGKDPASLTPQERAQLEALRSGQHRPTGPATVASTEEVADSIPRAEQDRRIQLDTARVAAQRAEEARQRAEQEERSKRRQTLSHMRDTLRRIRERRLEREERLKGPLNTDEVSELPPGSGSVRPTVASLTLPTTSSGSSLQYSGLAPQSGLVATASLNATVPALTADPKKDTPGQNAAPLNAPEKAPATLVVAENTVKPQATAAPTLSA